MENCTMAEDCDLTFEGSTLEADISGKVTSVKNPTSGRIVADGFGEIILEDTPRHQPTALLRSASEIKRHNVQQKTKTCVIPLGVFPPETPDSVCIESICMVETNRLHFEL